jgi:hypothetical protein
VNWAANRVSKNDTIKIVFPLLGIDTAFVTPGNSPLNEPGQIDIFNTESKKVFGLKFGFMPENAFDKLNGSIQVGISYRSNGYFPNQLKFPEQPLIECRPARSVDSVELFVQGIQVQMWNTGDTTPTVVVPKNYSNKKYLVRGKTDPNMKGWLYSKPFRINEGECFTTNIINHYNGEELKLYPNPTNGDVSIETSLKIKKIQIKNCLGSDIFQGEYDSKLNLKFLQKGLYYILFFLEDGMITKKMIIQ